MGGYILGRLNRNGAAGWGLLLVTIGMTAIAVITLSPKVSGQFGVIVNVVVNLIVLAYAAAGLSLVVGTRARRARAGDRLLGIGAILACVLLLASSPPVMLFGAIVAMVAAWGLYRVFARRR